MRNLAGHVPLLLGLPVAWMLVSGCRAPDLGQSPPKPPLRIGAVEDSAPLMFRHEGRWDGVEADLGRALAARLGMKPVFVALPPEKLSAALLDGKVDMLMAGMVITEERRVQLDFSTPYLVVGQAALIRDSDLLRFNTEIKIRSARVRIGVVAGSAGDRLVSRYFTNGTRTVFPNAEEAVEAVRQNKIDMLIYDAPAAWWLVQRQGRQLALAPPLFDREEVAWAFRRGSVTLRASANQAVVDWQKDGSLETILQRWIPFSK